MSRKEIFLKIGIIPSLFFIVSLIVFLVPFFYNYYYDFYTSAFEIIIRGFFINDSYFYFYSYGDAQLISWLIFTFLLISFLIFLLFLRLLENFIGFPSIPEAKQYYSEKHLLEKKKRLLKAKLNHQDRLFKLEEEKKKYL